MVIALVLLATAVALGLAVTYRWPAWLRTIAIGVSIGLHIITIIWLLALWSGFAGVAVILVAVYNSINLLRIIIGKAEVHYLWHSVRQTSLWLGLAQLAAVYYLLVDSFIDVSVAAMLYILAASQLALAIIVWLGTRRQLRTTTVDMQAMEYIADKDLPTVTVAVPVRNEAGQLEACLTSILASNYPKLEVLAFDDHSHDKTPDIIKSFAHAGVRFIRTSETSDGWLAKNQAYDSLAKAANGEYILFCGADIRLGIRSIRHMVTVAQNRHKRMVAILPQNVTTQRIPLLQAMRYFWEMAPPRRMFNRPPVLSSCWLIEHKALQRYGGFAAVKQSMSSEAHLALSAIADNDGYSFLRSDSDLDITSQKALAEQRSTALLRRYPQAHRRPEVVLLYGLGLALLVAGPVAAIIYSLIVGMAVWPVAVASVIALALQTVSFAAIQRPIFPRITAWRSYAAFLPAVLLDIYYLNRSMLQYEFATVSWKERNVSQPVMRSTRD